jgi:hypothetical protein
LSYLTLDVVSTFVYGEAARAKVLSGHAVNRKRVQDDMVTNRNWARFWKKGKHFFLEKLVLATHAVLARLDALLEIYSAGETDESSGGVDAYAANACLSTTQSTKTEKSHDNAVVTKLVARGHDPAYVLSETRDHVIAGSDTTTTVLAYLFHRLAESPAVYDALRRAVSQLKLDVDGGLDGSALDSCEYLDHVITEALRLYAAIPMTLPRVLTAAMKVQGIDIPSGTNIGAQCYSLHRDKRIFPDPEVFEPSRWSQATKQMRDQMWAFSSGSRACIGKSLALMEMKFVVARVVQTYSFEVISLERNGMDMKEDTTRFTMLPKDRRMKMHFTRID